MFSLSNLASPQGQFLQETLIVRVKDGTLDLKIEDWGGDPYWVLNSVEIRPAVLQTLGVVATPPGPSVADGSTVDTVQGYNARPGSILTASTDLGTVCLAGPRPQRRGRTDPGGRVGPVHVPGAAADGAGTATVMVTNATGEQTGCNTIQYVLPTFRRLDFNSPVSPTMDPTNPGDPNGYRGVLPTDVYTAGQGFGWLSGVQGSADRGTGLPAGPHNKLLRDLHFGSTATPGCSGLTCPRGRIT